MPRRLLRKSKFICDESEAAGAPGGESFFSRPREKTMPVKSEGAVMDRPSSKKDVV